MRDSEPAQYRFNGFHLDARDRQLMHEGQAVRLEPKSFDVLRHLLENAGHLVSKQDLIDAVWSRAFVSDNSLTRCIHQIRGALQDDADQPTYIETVPGTGYRFIARVETDIEGDAMRQAARPAPRFRLWRAIAAAALVVGVMLAWSWSTQRAEAPGIKRLAVLPLTNLTGAADQEYFVQGVHEALVAELSRAGTIDVISRTSVLGFRNTEMSVPEIAKRLDVDAIIEGSVARAGDNLTVTAQLIAVDPERHLWAERYHRGVDDLFEIATDIVADIAEEIAMELAPDRLSAGARPPTTNKAAYDAYVQGRFYFEQRMPDAYRMARESFQRAIELDPAFALPYVGLAHTFGSAAIFGAIRPEDGFPEARRLAERALELDDTLEHGHLLLAGVLFYWDWNTGEAERKALHALSLNPNLANAYRILSEVYSAQGRHAEALATIEKARAIDPLPPTSQFKPALVLYLGREFDQAIGRTEAALVHYPAYWQGHYLMCLSLAAVRRYQEAVASCERAAEFSGNLPMAAGALGYALALAGRADEAEAIATALVARSDSEYVGPASIAIIYGELGRMDDAFEFLERAYGLRDQRLVHAEHAAYFDSMRRDSRFRSLRQRHAEQTGP